MLSKLAPFNNGLRLRTLLPCICHRCRIRIALPNIRSEKLPVALQLARRNSTIASTTAINGNRGLPETLQNLHSSLGALQKDAALYINWSQLRLALRGIESANAVIRIAGLYATMLMVS